MTEYLKPKFTVAVGSKEYRDNWDSIFGKKEGRIIDDCKELKLDVLVRHDSDRGVFVAQCLQYDVAVQAPSMEKLKKRFAHVFAAYLVETLVNDQEPRQGGNLNDYHKCYGAWYKWDGRNWVSADDKDLEIISALLKSKADETV